MLLLTHYIKIKYNMLNTSRLKTSLYRKLVIKVYYKVYVNL